MTGPKETSSKSRILSRASDGDRLEPKSPQLLVLAAASSDGAAEGRRRLVQAEPSWRVSASAVSSCGGAALGILDCGESKEIR